MPFTAKIKRDDPFRNADQREIDGMCRRIACAAEHFALAGWREDSGYRIYHFTTWAKARAMQHWIDRSGIAHRPLPKLGPTPEENSRSETTSARLGVGDGRGARGRAGLPTRPARGERGARGFQCRLRRRLGAWPTER